MASQFQKALQQIQEGWSDSQAQYDQRFGGVKLPEAEYIGKLADFRLDFVKFKGSPTLIVRRKLIVLDGQYKGMSADDMMDLQNEWGLLNLRRFIDVAGYEAPKADEPEAIEAVINTIAKEKGIFKFDVRHWKQGDGINIVTKAMIDLDGEGVPQDSSPIGSSDEEDEKTLPENTNVKTAKKEVDVDKTKDVKEVKDQFTDMNRKDLKKYIKDNELGFRVTAKMKDEEVRTKIRELTEDTSPTQTEDNSEVSDEELAKRLMVFAATNGITGLKKSMTLDDMIDICDEYQIAKSEIDEEDIKLLTMLQLDGIITDD